MSVRHRTVLHPTTVQAIATGKVKKQRKVIKAERPAAPEVETIKVDRKLWAVVLRQAGGDPSRIRIVSATEVYIH
jgi:hypothetical protein